MASGGCGSVVVDLQSLWCQEDDGSAAKFSRRDLQVRITNNKFMDGPLGFMRRDKGLLNRLANGPGHIFTKIMGKRGGQNSTVSIHGEASLGQRFETAAGGAEPL